MILKLLEELAGLEIQPYNDVPYDAQTVEDQGFQYVGTLSPRIQRLGTLILRERKVFAEEFDAFEQREKEVKESNFLTSAEKINIATKELPQRLGALAERNEALEILGRVFGFEVASELLMNEKRVIFSKMFSLRIFSGWEVVIIPFPKNQPSPKERTTTNDSKNWPKMPTVTIM